MKNTTTTKTEVKKEETKKELMKYRLEMIDGTIIEGITSLRAFKPNEKNRCINSGYQVKVSDGNFGGSIMIIDYTKQKGL